MDSPCNTPDKAKRYARIKYTLSAIDIVYSGALIFFFLKAGWSSAYAFYIISAVHYPYFYLPLYVYAALLSFYVCCLPLNFYRSFVVEHAFGLTTQKSAAWLIDQLKGFFVSCIIYTFLLGSFYFLVNIYPRIWWILVSPCWIFFSVIMAKLLPIVLIPFFFTITKLDDAELRQRIIRLAEKMKTKILDVFQIDFSKKTLKANAAFTGWGKTRRVLIADTLKEKYSYDEIEVILAHEFAHYQSAHLAKLIFMNSLFTCAVFYIMYLTYPQVLSFFHLKGLADLASLPLVALYILVLELIFKPMENYISRRFERRADAAALSVTCLPDAFISMMEKLSIQNLIPRRAHPLIKIFFFEHPPVEERIAQARAFKSQDS